jgi:hypothetical protein
MRAVHHADSDTVPTVAEDASPACTTTYSRVAPKKDEQPVTTQSPSANAGMDEMIIQLQPPRSKRECGARRMEIMSGR